MKRIFALWKAIQGSYKNRKGMISKSEMEFVTAKIRKAKQQLWRDKSVMYW